MAFESLVLSGDYKEIVHALSEEQLLRDVTFDDVVQGKGLGFVMLLAGEPGTGKILTAESGDRLYSWSWIRKARKLSIVAEDAEANIRDGCW